MNTHEYLILRLIIVFAVAVAAPVSGQNAAVSNGTIEGRVLNETNGNYLNNARVTIPGTSLEVFTNEIGEYRLTNAPTGQVTVQVAFTGLAPETATVSVQAGQRVTHNFTLNRTSASAGSGTVVMDAFVTAAARDMSGSEIALNEQRFSANLKNVVSADEFGDIGEGNIGEFLKFIPGITIDMVGSDARNISVRGLPPTATAVMVDGAPMASAASSAPSRVFELEQVSINNVSRVEVTKSPTPDLPANAVGGSVNMISRSAFERSKPLLNYRVFLNWNKDQGFFEKTQEGPSRESTNHTNPSFDFSYIKPVNENFGFTVSASFSEAFQPDYRAQPTWLPTAGSSALATYDNPFLRNYQTFYGPKSTRRMSLGTTADWRISHGNVLSVSVQWNDYDALINNRFANMNTLGTISNQPPAAWDSTFTQSRAGAASINRTGYLLKKYGNTTHLSLKFVHDGPEWLIETGATYSSSKNHHRNGEEGYAHNYSFVLPGLNMRLADIDQSLGVPQEVNVTTPAGLPVDWTSLASYRFENILIAESNGHDEITSARLSGKRDFTLPVADARFSIKTGVDVRQMVRDISDSNRTRYNFVGPDGSSAAASADNLAGNYDLVDYNFYDDGSPHFGEPWMEYPSGYKIHDLFRTHPEYFVEDLPYKIQNEAQNSRKLTERVSAAYIRTDWRFLNNRLWVVGGVRYERTDDEGEGIHNDPTALYMRGPDGEIMRNASGTPIRIPGLSPAEAARLQYVTRGARAERNYDGFFPSANVVYNLTDQLLLRASYAQTISRPNLQEIIPGTTVSDPSTTNPEDLRITVNNTGLNPWTADNYDVGLEYYFGKTGNNVVSAGGFRKDISDFFATRREESTPELLNSFGLDDSFLGYDVIYKFNSGDARVQGYELNYRQLLTFLPRWAQGLSVFYNMTAQRLSGSTLADFSNFVRRTDNYGFTFSRPKFTVRFKVNDMSRQRRELVTGTNVGPSTYRWYAPRRAVDIDFEYRLRRGVSLFAAGRNVFDAPSRHTEIYGEGTPEYARNNSYWLHDVNFVFGVKGTF